MHLFDDLFFLQRIDQLIRTRATGTPAQLATRLETSERNTYRLIEQLRDHGLPIEYDKNAHTYYYTHPVKLAFSIAVDGKNLMMITGGEKNFNNFFGLPNSGRMAADFCNAFQPDQSARDFGWGAGGC